MNPFRIASAAAPVDERKAEAFVSIVRTIDALEHADRLRVLAALAVWYEQREAADLLTRALRDAT